MKQWSKKYDCCQRCGTIDRKHNAKGLCVACYDKRWCEENKEHIAERKKQWRKDNKEHRADYRKRWFKNNRDYHKQYYKDNKERLLAYCRDYYQENKEYYRQYNHKYGKQYRKNHPEKGRANEARRRARISKSVGSHTGEDIIFLLNLSGHRCQNCNGEDRLEIDHIIPLSKEGRNDIFNLQVLCKSCNASKGNRRCTDYRSNEFKKLLENMVTGE